MAVRELSDEAQSVPESAFQTFQIHPPLLDSGKQTTVLAKCDILTGTVMVAD
ncbi:MAG: hypothetical protein QOF51_2328, partial [Chloroflexota bacterium]|nr:hypothetical protein [Chloroflexota bacterium]